VGELLERWPAVASPDWSPKTVLETCRFLDRLVLPRFGPTPLRKLTTAALDPFYADLRKLGGWAASHWRRPACDASTSWSAGACSRSEVRVALGQPHPAACALGRHPSPGS